MERFHVSLANIRITTKESARYLHPGKLKGGDASSEGIIFLYFLFVYLFFILFPLLNLFVCFSFPFSLFPFLPSYPLPIDKKGSRRGGWVNPLTIDRTCVDLLIHAKSSLIELAQDFISTAKT